MDSEDLQILSVEIRGLGKKFAAQIVPRSEELTRAVERSFNRLAETGNLQRIIDAEAEVALKAAIQRAMQSYQVTKAITDMLISGLLGKVRR